MPPTPTETYHCMLFGGRSWLGTALVPRLAGGAGHGSLRLGHHPRGTLIWDWLAGQICNPLPPLYPLPGRSLEPQQEGATAPWGTQRGPEEQEDKSRPKTPYSALCLAPGIESDPTHCPRPAFISLGPLPQLERGCNRQVLS